MNSKEYPLTTNKIAIPEMFTLTTGGEEEVQIGQAGDNFFTAVREGIGNSEQDITDSQVEFYHFREDDGRTIVWPSDGYLRLLTVHDHIRASVLDRRDGFNYHQVNFAYYPSNMSGEKSENEDEIITTYLDKILTNLSFPDRARGIFSQQESYALYPPGLSQGEAALDKKPDKMIHILEIQESLVASVIVQHQENRREISTTDYLKSGIKQNIDKIIQRLIT